MDILEFEKFLNRKKQYRNLDDIYKTSRFLQLYLKMYEYILSIPKEKIVVKGFLQSNFILNFLRYIYYFLKAKNFYHWKERLYKLITEKHGATKFTTYELLYGKKAKEFFNEYLEKCKNACLEKYGVDNPSQSTEVKEKKKQTNLERRGCEYPFQSEEVKERIKQTNLKKRGCEYPFQSEEVKERIKQTNLERHGVENPFQLAKNNGSHSKIADEFCMELYTKLPEDIKPYCIFFKKSNKEYMLEGEGRIFRYDFTILMEKIKLIIEFDGLYWHGLKKDQRFVKCHNKEVPVQEVWKQDEEKQRLAEMNGFKVIRVREDEYMEDKEMILQRVVEEILKLK